MKDKRKQATVPTTHQRRGGKRRRRLEFALFAPPERVGDILPRVLRRIQKRTAHRPRRNAA